MISVFNHTDPFTLESGETLPGFHLAYTTHGQLNADKNNAIWIFHALTANSDASEWWPGMIGSGKIFDPAKYFIICVNVPGSCYGSIGPLDINPATHLPYYHQFPLFTIRDMIRAYQFLRVYLNIEKIHLGIGGSMGGQQLLEWAIEEPSLFEHIVPLATNAFHSPWGIAFNASQRFAIEADATWKEEAPQAGLEGMKVARGIALISYRHYETYYRTQSEDKLEKTDKFKSESYQRYQGEKLARRFNAFSYYFLSKSMDSHQVGRGRQSVEQALKKIKAKTMVIGITTDILFPLNEQQLLAEQIPGARLKTIHSPFGHDGFLLEFEKISYLLHQFLTNQLSDNPSPRKQTSTFNLFL